MPTFNKLDTKLINLYIDNKDKFSNEEMKDIFIRLSTFKKDGTKYNPNTIKSRITSLNKKLITHDIMVLTQERNEIVSKFQEERKENPIEEKKEDEKMDIDMAEVKIIKTPYIKFMDNPKNKELFNDLSKRKERNQLLDKINGVYSLLQLNSGVRINELLSKDFVKDGDNIVFKLSKATSKGGVFKPLFMTPDEWLEILNKIRVIVGKEKVSAVNKRYNAYLKSNFKTITKTHTLRKVYMFLMKDKVTNPLNHSDPEMKKVYDVVKCDNKEEVAEVNEEVKDNQDKNKKKCNVCNIITTSKNWSRHVKSNKHKKNK